MKWQDFVDDPQVINLVRSGEMSIKQMAQHLGLKKWAMESLRNKILGRHARGGRDGRSLDSHIIPNLPEDDDTEELLVDVDTTRPAPKEPRIEQKVDSEKGCLELSARGQDLIMSVDDLVRVSGLDTKKWRIVRHAVKTWTVTIKGPDDLPRISRNWGVTAHCEERMGDSVQMPRVLTPLKRVPSKPSSNKRKTALLIGDPQIGFRRRPNGDLIPMHDRRALDLLLQMAATLQPDVIICMGDTLDLAEWSTKFPRPMELRDTTQASLNECHWWFAAFRATCPSSRIITLEGNHDDRIIRALREKVPAAVDLTAVNESRPAMEMSRLLNLQDLDVEYVGPYPEPMWLWDEVEVTHGETVRAKSGQTVTAEIREAHHSKVFGHIHRVEVAHKTIWGPTGPKTIFSASPGCTCRIAPGAVPGVKPRQNWQQGWGLMTFDGKTRQSQIELGIIRKGTTWFKGVRFEGKDMTEKIGSDIGFRMATDWLVGGE